MKILHYFLGFPPYRSGGLTKYAFDLMSFQAMDGHEVMALWPGKIQSYSFDPRIVERKPQNGIRSFELVNPLPVSLDEGINEFEAFTKGTDIKVFLEFLSAEKPDAIHFHTLMGLYREFVEAAEKLRIRTVMTSHDYFGFCPKITLFRYGESCEDDNKCRDCVQCNVSPLSLKKIKIMQSPFYRWAKDTAAVRAIRKKHRDDFFETDTVPAIPADMDTEEMAQKYRNLRSYYVSMYEAMDCIHFNSEMTKQIYERYMRPKDSKVISISHQGIEQHERIHVSFGKKIIVCLAPAKPYKGWNVLKSACDRLWADGVNFELRLFCPVPEKEPYMVVREDGFSQADLENIFAEADMLIAPSICFETFGFTVLEALSYGVPVIVSDHVGAKDIVGNNGMIVQAGNADELKNAILSMDKTVEGSVKSWRQFLDENYQLY